MKEILENCTKNYYKLYYKNFNINFKDKSLKQRAPSSADTDGDVRMAEENAVFLLILGSRTKVLCSCLLWLLRPK